MADPNQYFACAVADTIILAVAAVTNVEPDDALYKRVGLIEPEDGLYK